MSKYRYKYYCSNKKCYNSLFIDGDNLPEEQYLCSKCGSPMNFIQKYNIDEINNHHNTQAENEAILSKQLGHPFCPYCHSAMVDKISGFSKGASVALFGIFAMGKVTKQWHCKSCGSDF